MQPKFLLLLYAYFFCRRDPKFLVKPKKNETDDDLANRIMEVKPKASRHLFLIRHGQYVVGPTDEERFLTPLGKISCSPSMNKKQE